ncbi:MAG: FtsX-like permease family protein [Spirochaetaceae bacterium]|nr:MAG: FtsX-like permease family protein [Spirochaetaceae bacterium]
MNAGLLFVALGAVIVTANALMLSVFERTKEIGTMRALGATRLKVTSLIALEVLFVMLASAALGLVLGFIAVYWLNNAQIVLSNQYLEILFGGQAIKGRITGGLLLSQLGAALLLAVLAMVYPLKRALGIGPARAMA